MKTVIDDYYKIDSDTELYSPAELEARVFRLLSRFGISANLKGFNYLTSAIIAVYYDPDQGKRIVKGLYRRVSEESGTTPACVEHSIRTALARIKYGNTNVKYFEISYDEYLTAKKFINLVAKKLREEAAEHAKIKEAKR